MYNPMYFVPIGVYIHLWLMAVFWYIQHLLGVFWWCSTMGVKMGTFFGWNLINDKLVQYKLFLAST